MKAVLLLALRGYKLAIGPMLGQNCRFYPVVQNTPPKQYANTVPCAVHGWLANAYANATRGTPKWS